MPIICPHCRTSYAVDPATLGAAGRNVRCSRCKEIWLARPEDATEMATASPAMAGAGQQPANTDAAAEWEAMANEDDGEVQETPVVDSTSISADWPAASQADPDWSATARSDEQDSDTARPRRLSRLRRLFRLPALKPPAWLPGSERSFGGLPTACATMGALVLALVIWRVDVVRLLPQTATFYKMVGLEVNLRGLMFKDVKISTETVEGKPVLVIEGVIVGEASKPVELPRLRFSVRDAQGAEIYAWNAVLQQPVLKPGEKAWFKSRLASPPPEGRNIDIRFFSKRDIASGNI
jgi:predicted Zn finger-like uncharacterized protein